MRCIEEVAKKADANVAKQQTLRALEEKGMEAVEAYDRRRETYPAIEVMAANYAEALVLSQ